MEDIVNNYNNQNLHKSYKNMPPGYQDEENNDDVHNLEINETINTQLLDVEEALQKAWLSKKTPFLIDTSPDEKMATFLRYQPDVVVLEAKMMVMELISKSRLPIISTESLPLPGSESNPKLQTLHRCLDFARRHLVTAMKYGKVLAINLGTAAVDFKTQFNDEMVGIKFINKNKKSNDDNNDNSINNNIDNNNDNNVNKYNDDKHIHPQSFFPPEVFIESGSQLKLDGWSDRIFREEDMKPHKNFAICRKEFRVVVLSQIDESDIDEMLFKEAMPDKSLFQIIKIDYEEMKDKE
jgi:hypothetical protein